MLFGALNSCSIVFEGSLVIISLFNNWWIFFVTSFRRVNLVWNDNFSFLNKPLSSLFRKNEVCAEWNTPAKRFKFCYISLLNARLYVSTKIRARRNKVAWNETYMSFLIVKKKSIFWSISPEYFIDNEPLISEECHLSHKVKIQRFDSL